jgi:hypothetical protein
MMNWKGFGGKYLGLIIAFAWEGLKKTMKNSNQFSRYATQDSNQAPSKYKSRALCID